MIPEYTWPLFWAFLLASLFTILLKITPLTAFKGNNLPHLLKKWLEFVPVAVMGALIGPDIFIYNGQLDLSFSNLFLLVSIPVALIAWKTSNFFITIAVGIALVIAARYFGIS